jgi:hypothetical protein
MPATRIAIPLALVACFAAGAVSAQPGPAGARPDEHLELLARWFEGDFDNNQQVVDEREAKTTDPHERIHSIFARVDLPAFGRHVFYVQQYQAGDPKKLYRQRLYRFSTDEAAGAIRLDILSFPDEAAVADAHMHPSKLAGLTPASMRSLPGCEVYWRREGDAFIGRMTPGACRITSRTTGQPIVISDDLRLTADEIWIGDRAHDASGAIVWGRADGVPHKLERARWLDCWTVQRKDGTTDEFDMVRGLAVHDQGHTVPIRHAGMPERYSFDLARLRSVQGQVPVLRLAIFEAGNPQSIAYAWADRDAWRIGINLRYVQVGCRPRAGTAAPQGH